MPQNLSKNITKKASAAKLKAHLALTGFVAVAVIALTLTVVGIFNYTALDRSVQPDGGQANALTAPVSISTQQQTWGNPRELTNE